MGKSKANAKQADKVTRIQHPIILRQLNNAGHILPEHSVSFISDPSLCECRLVIFWVCNTASILSCLYYGTSETSTTLNKRKL